ncbi:aldo/keto reductase [Aspergillus luchuensis]|uniref:Aldo/keto reductase n=1 Tax=Aspergillus kawachii TaxID=1069201 RepID=A0A146FVJ7_ASPKA|nr:aldo/keto reductase [Aspergillus luchuensis]
MVKSLRFADGVEVPVPGFGAMGISFALGNNLSYDEAEPVLLKALELGCTFWDTAPIVASKCGIAAFEDGRVTNSASHIRTYIEGTIERLGFTPDLYYLHRIDPTRIDAVQAEYSAFETLHESDCLISTARELGIAYVAYGPLGHGWLVDDFPYLTPDDFELNDYRRQIPKFQGENFYANKRIVDGFKELASRKRCTLPQISLAWVAAQGLISIPGTTKPGRLEENWRSREIEFTDEELNHMRAIVDSLKPRGDRYNEVAAKDIGN